MQAGRYGIRPYISANSMPAYALPPQHRLAARAQAVFANGFVKLPAAQAFLAGGALGFHAKALDRAFLADYDDDIEKLRSAKP